MIDPLKCTADQPLFYVEIPRALRPLLHPCVHVASFAQREGVTPIMCHIVIGRTPQFAHCADLFTHWEDAAREAIHRLEHMDLQT